MNYHVNLENTGHPPLVAHSSNQQRLSCNGQEKIAVPGVVAAPEACSNHSLRPPLHPWLWLQAMGSNYFLWIIAVIAVLAVLSKLTGAI